MPEGLPETLQFAMTIRLHCLGLVLLIGFAWLVSGCTSRRATVEDFAGGTNVSIRQKTGDTVIGPCGPATPSTLWVLSIPQASADGTIPYDKLSMKDSGGHVVALVKGSVELDRQRKVVRIDLWASAPDSTNKSPVSGPLSINGTYSIVRELFE